MKLLVDSPELKLAIETRDQQIAYGKRNTARIDRQISDMRAKEHPIASFIGKVIWYSLGATFLLIFWGSIIASLA